MLDWIRTFVAVYRAGSITGAARALHLSQPTVSQHLKALEAHLGAELFDRLPRGVAATAAGHDLAAAVGSHIDRVEVAVEAARRNDGPSIGTVRLGGPAELLSELAVPALAPALEQGARLRIRLGLAGALISALRGRELDLVLATSRVRAAGVVYEPIYDETFVLVAGPRWADRLPAGAVKRRGAAALDGAPVLAYAQHLPICRRFWKVVFDARLAGSPRLVAPDLRLLARATAAGAGITVLPAYLARPWLDRGELIQLVDPAEPPRNTIHLAYRKGGLDEARVGVAVDLLRRAAPGWS